MHAVEASITIVAGEVVQGSWIALARCGGITAKSVGRHTDAVGAATSALRNMDDMELALAMAFDGTSFDALEKAIEAKSEGTVDA